MERLTKRLSNGNATWNYPIICFGEDDSRSKVFKSVHRQKACEKLAAYEETGLGPEEIERILDSYGRGMTLRTENAQRLEIIKEIPIDRLRELAQAEKTGQLVKFPFIAMVEQSLRDGTMKPMSDQTHNGRYAVVYKSERWASPLIDICGTPYNTEQADERMCELFREAAEAALNDLEADYDR